MSDSTGSVYPITMVFIFIAIMSGFLAFSVNYNKAYKMKNKIITILEQNNNNVSSEEVMNEIKSYATEIGYNAASSYTKSCDGVTFTPAGNSAGWCYKANTTSGEKTFVTGGSTIEGGDIKEYESTYVDVVTFVSIDVPVFNRIFPNLTFFRVTGSTKTITQMVE